MYFCLDDPIIDKRCIPLDKIMNNSNILMATNKYGAHLCSFEHFFTYDQWFIRPAFEYFSYFKDRRYLTQFESSPLGVNQDGEER